MEKEMSKGKELWAATSESISEKELNFLSNVGFFVIMAAVITVISAVVIILIKLI